MGRKPLLKKAKRRTVWIDDPLWSEIGRKAQRTARTASGLVRIALEREVAREN